MTTARRAPRTLRALLTGGDRRSLARAGQARDLVRASPERVPEFAAVARDGDGLVAMRALDVMEKLARENPGWVEPRKRLFLGDLADSPSWEVRLQVVRALPLFTWTAPQRRRVLEILFRDAAHPRPFVRAWAVDALALFAARHRALRPAVRRLLRDLDRSGSKALAARARAIRRRSVAS